MFNIEQYLKRFTLHISGGVVQKEKVIEVVKGVIGVDITKEQIEVKDGILTLKVRPIIKSELMLKKELLLEKLKEADVFVIR